MFKQAKYYKIQYFTSLDKYNEVIQIYPSISKLTLSYAKLVAIKGLIKNKYTFESLQFLTNAR